ncbi:GtrA family protein [Patescibacteria group bacterium]|nr:MAG: GtrA family protein [Patescibacteria group bacterium]
MVKKLLLFLKQQDLKQFLKFCVVGTVGTAIDFGLFYLLVESAHIWYLLAATISFIVAVINNYIFNKFWTFEDRDKDFLRQFGRFLVVSIIGLGLNVLILYILVEFAGMWYILAKVLATGVVLIWNFFANKYWTFKKM